MQLNNNTNAKNSHIQLPVFSKPITSVSVEIAKAGTSLTLYAANDTGSNAYATLSPVVGANTFTVTENFNTAYLKSSGVTVITSVTVTTGATIRIADIKDVAATGVTGASATYEPVSFTGEDDTAVTAFDGTIVTAVSVDNTTKTLTYTVSPNYTGTAREGSITLTSADNDATVTIKVSQKADQFEVSPASITLGGDSGATAEFTLTSDFEVDAPDVSAPDKFSVSGPVDNVYTVTALADGGAAEAELGTITFTRKGDSKPISVTVSQTAAGGSSSGTPWSHTFSATKEFASANSTATISGLNWTLATTYNSGSYFANEAGGIHIGSGSSSPKEIIFSTSAYTENVQSVGFTCKTNDANNWTATVTVGGTELVADSSNAFTSSNTDLKFTSASALSGEIIITIKHSNTSKKNIYIQALSINN